MRAVPSRTRTAVLGALAAVTVAIPLGVSPASAASAQAMNGNWGPFTRCPVDAPAMLAADGTDNVPLCIASNSESGTIKLGNTVVTTAGNNLQFGVVRNVATGQSTVVAPEGGALVGDPAEVPGGLLGLMCTPGIPVISDICDSLADASLNRVVATVESVGTPANFDLDHAMTGGQPIVDIPIRIRLANPLLGSKCYIGTAADPIMLRPQNSTAPAIGADRFAADGTSERRGQFNRISLTGNAQDDATFSVPKVTGCGLLGSLNWAVNLKTGLPSAAGNNTLVLNDTASYTAGLAAPGSVAPNAGQVLSDAWHSGVTP